MKATPKKMLLAALLAMAPAGVALAAQDCSGDAHAAYHMAFSGEEPGGYRCVPATWQQAGTAGPSGPIIAAADTACGRDPFEGYWRAFGTGGPAHLCGLMVPEQAGAQGPAGPTMPDQRADAHYGYTQSFRGD